MGAMQITVLAGGVGGARFTRGLVHHLRADPALADSTVTVIGNTGDDITLFGLRVCPDLDTVVYTLGGGVDEGQGWGRDSDTHAVMGELAALEVGPGWFGLGDRDLGTHLARTQWLSRGVPLSEVTSRIAARWGLPERGVRLLPATDDPIETHVVVADGDGGDGERAIHFQEWWVRHGARLPAHRFTVAGLAAAAPAPGVLDAIRAADVVLLPPSNPVVSIGIILGVPGLREAVRGTRAPVVGVSPILSGRPVRGHADACLAPLGVEVSAAGVAGLYADLLDGWLVDDADAPDGARAGYPSRLRLRSLDLLMRDETGAARIAAAALDLAAELGAGDGHAR